MDRPRLIAFDLDGTLARGTTFIWQTLHDYFQTDPERRKTLHRQYFAGEISYEDWFLGDIEMLQANGITRQGVERAIAPIELTIGAREVVDTLRGRGMLIAIISGSLNVVLDKLFPDNPFDAVMINRIEFDEQGQLSGWQATPYDVEKKADGLKVLSQRFGVPLEQTVFVGDNYNDLTIAEIAGRSIAFNCKSDELARRADHVVLGEDLRQIIPLIDAEI